MGSPHFSCGQCAGAPRLPQIQGCWEETKKPFARYGEFEFKRCPLTYHSHRVELVTRDVAEGRLKEASFHEKMGFPAKRLAAMRYVQSLLGEISDEHGT